MIGNLGVIEAPQKRERILAEFHTFAEGTLGIVKYMHTGAYDDEPAAVVRMTWLAHGNGYGIDLIDRAAIMQAT